MADGAAPDSGARIDGEVPCSQAVWGRPASIPASIPRDDPAPCERGAHEAPDTELPEQRRRRRSGRRWLNDARLRTGRHPEWQLASPSCYADACVFVDRWAYSVDCRQSGTRQRGLRDRVHEQAASRSRRRLVVSCVGRKQSVVDALSRYLSGENASGHCRPSSPALFFSQACNQRFICGCRSPKGAGIGMVGSGLWIQIALPM